jgi:hypothetical protein
LCYQEQEEGDEQFPSPGKHRGGDRWTDVLESPPRRPSRSHPVSPLSMFKKSMFILSNLLEPYVDSWCADRRRKICRGRHVVCVQLWLCHKNLLDCRVTSATNYSSIRIFITQTSRRRPRQARHALTRCVCVCVCLCMCVYYYYHKSYTTFILYQY